VSSSSGEASCELLYSVYLYLYNASRGSSELLVITQGPTQKPQHLKWTSIVVVRGLDCKEIQVDMISAQNKWQMVTPANIVNATIHSRVKSLRHKANEHGIGGLLYLRHDTLFRVSDMQV